MEAEFTPRDSLVDPQGRIANFNQVECNSPACWVHIWHEVCSLQLVSTSVTVNAVRILQCGDKIQAGVTDGAFLAAAIANMLAINHVECATCYAIDILCYEKVFRLQFSVILIVC